MKHFNKVTLSLLTVPPILVGMALGAHQTRAGAFMPWMMSVSYWVTISIMTWWCLALATVASRWFLRPWSPPDWVSWILGTFVGSFLARPIIYGVAHLLQPFMEDPVLRKMPAITFTLDFFVYYFTNWSVVIIMWLSACFVAARWQEARAKDLAPLPTTSPQVPQADDVGAEIFWQRDAFLSRIPRALGKEIIALSAEDHYVRVHTKLGNALVLGAIANAIKAVESASEQGLRVHRSWWVSKSAVASHAQSARKLTLKLINGLEVPVSQTYREVVRLSGVGIVS